MFRRDSIPGTLTLSPSADTSSNRFRCLMVSEGCTRNLAFKKALPAITDQKKHAHRTQNGGAQKGTTKSQRCTPRKSRRALGRGNKRYQSFWNFFRDGRRDDER